MNIVELKPARKVPEDVGDILRALVLSTMLHVTCVDRLKA